MDISRVFLGFILLICVFITADAELLEGQWTGKEINSNAEYKVIFQNHQVDFVALSQHGESFHCVYKTAGPSLYGENIDFIFESGHFKGSRSLGLYLMSPDASSMVLAMGFPTHPRPREFVKSMYGYSFVLYAPHYSTSTPSTSTTTTTSTSTTTSTTTTTPTTTSTARPTTTTTPVPKMTTTPWMFPTATRSQGSTRPARYSAPTLEPFTGYRHTTRSVVKSSSTTETTIHPASTRPHLSRGTPAVTGRHIHTPKPIHTEEQTDKAESKYLVSFIMGSIGICLLLSACVVAAKLTHQNKNEPQSRESMHLL